MGKPLQTFCLLCPPAPFPAGVALPAPACTARGMESTEGPASRGTVLSEDCREVWRSRVAPAWWKSTLACVGTAMPGARVGFQPRGAGLGTLSGPSLQSPGVPRTSCGDVPQQAKMTNVSAKAFLSYFTGPGVFPPFQCISQET